MADCHETKKERPAIEFGAVTSASSTILLAHNQPEKKKKMATTTAPDTMKADSRKLTLTPNSNSHLASSQQTNRSGESSDTISSSPAQPPSPSSKLKRLNPFTNENKDDDDNDGYIDIDAPLPKKPHLISPRTITATPSTQNPNPSSTTDPSSASLQRTLAAAVQQLRLERARRRAAERRASEYAQHGARLLRWVADMYTEHRRQQGGRREEEVEAFLRDIRDELGPKAWGGLLWLGRFLRDNVDEGEEGREGGGGGREESGGSGGAGRGVVRVEKKEIKKEAAGRDGANDGEKVAEVGKSGGGAVAKSTVKLEDRVSTKSSVSLVEAAVKMEKI